MILKFCSVAAVLYNNNRQCRKAVENNTHFRNIKFTTISTCPLKLINTYVSTARTIACTMQPLRRKIIVYYITYNQYHIINIMIYIYNNLKLRKLCKSNSVSSQLPTSFMIELVEYSLNHHPNTFTHCTITIII